MIIDQVLGMSVRALGSSTVKENKLPNYKVNLPARGKIIITPTNGKYYQCLGSKSRTFPMSFLVDGKNRISQEEISNIAYIVQQ